MSTPQLPFPDPEKIFTSWWPIIIGVAVGIFYAARQWLRGAQFVEEVKLEGKVVIITGGNSGIGNAAALYMARRGGKVIIACRDEALGREAAEEMKTLHKQEVTVMKCDLASFKSIREFVEAFKKKEKKLDILINNAGVMMSPQSLTEEKFDVQFGVNYLGTFLLTELLLDLLKASDAGRIVNTSASASNLGEINFDDINMTEDYSPGQAYAQSKLAVNLYTLHLARRLKDTKVIVNVTNPGIVNTNGHRNLPFKNNSFLRFSFSPIVWFLMKTPSDGAQTTLLLACSKSIDGVSGKYYKDCTLSELTGRSLDEELQERLHKESVKWTGLEKKTK
ncbi:retinol dehydrogenase 13-like [Haliotis rubra]|uniref:retinol dehydrogenase 13-like n=1 Tax=Haliotis rubra TaxID=36100 RepID=UPI001EE5AF18|nr:retinol dehydrogenase 13-like [Haliotis rubra]XP_046585024.1 retinol dehydrogenase 13-like [Haliotis rubra]